MGMPRGLRNSVALQNPSADRCLAVQVAARFLVQPALTGEESMNAIAPTQTPELQRPRTPLPAGRAAAGEARRRVTAAVRAWKVPVDLDSAVLLTSELVTNALRHSCDGTVSIDISCSFGR